MSVKLPRKIYLSAGHSNRAGRDRGASGNGFIEGELTVDARNRITKYLLAFKFPQAPNEGSLLIFTKLIVND